MSSDKYNVLNFTHQAINSLEKYADAFGNSDMGISKVHLLTIINMLHKSVKFMLPNRGSILDQELSVQNIKQEWVDLTILPFPICSFEFTFFNDDEIEADLVESTKRISLAWDVNADDSDIQRLNSWLELLDDKSGFKNGIVEIKKSGGVAVLAISYIDEIEDWIPCPKAICLRNGSQIEQYVQNGTAKLGLQADFFNIFPEYAMQQAKIQGSYHVLNSNVVLDSNGEMMAVIQACCVLNCQNVSVKNLSVPKALAKQREKKGLKPFYEYKVLDIKSSGFDSEGSESKSTGSGASKRMHFRRGHIRRYSTGKMVFVRSSIINSGGGINKGSIDKSYRII